VVVVVEVVGLVLPLGTTTGTDGTATGVCLGAGSIGRFVVPVPGLVVLGGAAAAAVAVAAAAVVLVVVVVVEVVAVVAAVAANVTDLVLGRVPVGLEAIQGSRGWGSLVGATGRRLLRVLRLTPAG